jgi:hypothetical protein
LSAIEGLSGDQLDIFSRMPRGAVTLYGLRDVLALDPLQLLVHCFAHELGERPVAPGMISGCTRSSCEASALITAFRFVVPMISALNLS